MKIAKTLYLVRHAKSSWKDTSLSDRDRPLNRRGTKNLPVMAARLRDHVLQADGQFPRPESIIASPALRASLTAQAMANALEFEPASIRYDERLYFQGLQAMCALIAELPAKQHTAMLVGHNPDLTQLHNRLNNVTLENMPTCAIATIRFDCNSWTTVLDLTGITVDFDFPKKELPSFPGA